MNYRHAYHAGAFQDVLKHAVLALVIAHLKAKDKPFTVLDTHAGIGRYDLTRDEARRTKEFEGGIARLFDLTDLPAELAPYLAIVRSFNPDGRLRWYPGSPCLVRALLRPADRLIAAELHPEDAEALAAAFARDRQVKVHHLDGYRALKAFLPPTPRRGLVLIDPAFEEADEFECMVDGLKAAHRRWAAGIYALWYPVKDRAELRRFHELLAASGIARIAVVEFSVLPRETPEALTGCGLILVNPPFGLLDALRRLLPELARRLAVRGAGGWSVEWLVPESGVPKPESGVPKPESGVPKPESGVPKPESGVPKPESGVPKTESAASIPRTPGTSPRARRAAPSRRRG